MLIEFGIPPKFMVIRRIRVPYPIRLARSQPGADALCDATWEIR